MIMKTFILFFIFSLTANAFTLNNNFGAGFKKNKVNVYIAGDTICPGNEISIEELASYVKPAVSKFWNEVPTSRLRLKAAGFSDDIPTIDINTARLCSPTDTACISDATTKNQDIIPPVNGIVIACNQLADNYDGNGVVAVTVPNNFSGKKITGAVILINENGVNSKFKTLSRDDRIGVIAHEIGHAIGLGHSEVAEALMYYKVQNIRKSLGQDDVDGVTYLYPIKVDGCGLIDGLVASTVALKGKNDDDDQNGGTPLWQMGIGFVLVILLAEILRLLKRQETRPAL